MDCDVSLVFIVHLPGGVCTPREGVCAVVCVFSDSSVDSHWPRVVFSSSDSRVDVKES